MSEIDLKAFVKLLDAIPGPNTVDKCKKALDLMASGDVPADPPAADKADASKSTKQVVALTDPAPAVALGEAPPPAVALADMPAPVVPAADPMPAAPLEGDPDNDSAVDEFDAKMMADLGISDPEAYASMLMAAYDAIKSLLVGGGDAGSVAMSRDLAVKGLTSQLEAVTKERNTLLSEKATAQAVACAAEVDALIRRAPALANERESWIALAKRSPAEFRRVATAFPATPSLTAPHAVALAKPTDATPPPAAIADNHPRLVAQRVSLAAAGIKGDAAERVIANVRKQLIESAG